MTETIVTHIDGDDWHWYYVNGELITEGHSSDNGIVRLVLRHIVGKIVQENHLIIHQFAFIDADLAQVACMKAGTLAKFIELGLDISEFDVELLVNNAIGR